MNHLTRSFRKALRRMTPGHAPNFMIIGAQKAGTSTLHHWLAQHPELFGTTPKELHFFNRDMMHGETLATYEAKFKTLRPGSKQFFESTPAYLFDPACPARIAGAYPKIKLIAVLREPVARAFSAWSMYQRLAEARLYPFGPMDLANPMAQALRDDAGNLLSFAACLQREQQLIDKGQPGGPDFIRRGFYLEQLERYWAHFAPENFLVLGFGELKTDPNAVVRKVFDFLDVKDPSIDFSQGKLQNQNTYHTNIEPAVEARLRQVFEPYNAQLFERLGRVVW